MRQQGAGEPMNFWPESYQGGLRVAPGSDLVQAEPSLHRPAEVSCVTAIALPAAQPERQLIIALKHRPVRQPLRDLPGRVDDEALVVRSSDPVYSALAVPTMMNARRAELGSDRQRRHRMAGLVPGRSHDRPPGRSVAGITATV